MRKIIYPGTFDPIHNGHIDIASRASKLFDELEFVVAINSDKKPLFSIETRIELIKRSIEHIPNIKVTDINHFSAFDIVKYKKIVFSESSIKELEKRYA